MDKARARGVIGHQRIISACNKPTVCRIQALPLTGRLLRWQRLLRMAAIRKVFRDDELPLVARLSPVSSLFPCRPQSRSGKSRD
jgi:hypothetical protein